MDTSGALGELCLEGSAPFLSFLSVSPAHSLFFDLQEDGAGRQLPKETRLEGTSERGQQRLPGSISYPRPNVPTVQSGEQRTSPPCPQGPSSVCWGHSAFPKRYIVLAHLSDGPVRESFSVWSAFSGEKPGPPQGGSFS